MTIRDPFIRIQLKTIVWYRILITYASLIILTVFLKDYVFQFIYYIPLFLFFNVLNVEFYSSYTIDIENILVLPISIRDMVNSRLNGVMAKTLIQLFLMYSIYFIRYALYVKNFFMFVTEIIVHITLFLTLKQAGKSIVYLLFGNGKKTHTITFIKIFLCFAIGIMTIFKYKMAILLILCILLFLLNETLIKNVDNEKILINGGV